MSWRPAPGFLAAAVAGAAVAAAAGAQKAAAAGAQKAAAAAALDPPLLSVELGLIMGLLPLPRGRPILRSDRGEPDSSASPTRKEPLGLPAGLRGETSELRSLRGFAVRISNVGLLGAPPAAAATACFGAPKS